MSSNLPLVRRSRKVLPWSGGLKLEINIPSQRIRAKWKGGLINEGGVISSEYGIKNLHFQTQIWRHCPHHSSREVDCHTLYGVGSRPVWLHPWRSCLLAH